MGLVEKPVEQRLPEQLLHLLALVVFILDGPDEILVVYFMDEFLYKRVNLFPDLENIPVVLLRFSS